MKTIAAQRTAEKRIDVHVRPKIDSPEISPKLCSDRRTPLFGVYLAKTIEITNHIAQLY
jgi:hypothetical protein